MTFLSLSTAHPHSVDGAVGFPIRAEFDDAALDEDDDASNAPNEDIDGVPGED